MTVNVTTRQTTNSLNKGAYSTLFRVKEEINSDFFPVGAQSALLEVRIVLGWYAPAWRMVAPHWCAMAVQKHKVSFIYLILKALNEWHISGIYLVDEKFSYGTNWRNPWLHL
ncbi:hypothetical protein [Alkalimonas sp.]|uniref:hypothetical protein n=1 Tax=Alkalimonas sp. TaxID=1872453 RepID=UPI00263ADC5C|nr:hypothetical protein [Alkalimonas sp.]MCC5825185.1 hypothetical protein [Alkalimonas sp.]